MNFWEFEKQTRVVFYRRIFKTVTGDVMAALMLSQLVYWNKPDSKGHSKLHVQRNGKMWLAKKRTDWEEEVGVSPKQADRALAVLLQQGLVETKVFKFAGTPTVHIWLNVPLLSEKISSILTKGENGLSPSVVMDSPVSSISFTEGTTKGTAEKGLAEDKTMKNTLLSTTAEEVAAKLAAEKKKEPLMNGKLSGGNVAAYWVRMMKYHYDLTPILTNLNKNQLSMCLKKVGEDFRLVLPVVMREWKDFAQETCDKVGMSTYPSMPSIGFVLQNLTYAVDFANKKQVKKVQLIAKKEAIDNLTAGASVDKVDKTKQGLSKYDIAQMVKDGND